MNGWKTLSELTFLLEQNLQSLQSLSVVAGREILKPAHREDCLNNARAGERQDGIYGPDTEIRLLFRGETI